MRAEIVLFRAGIIEVGSIAGIIYGCVICGPPVANRADFLLHAERLRRSYNVGAFRGRR